MSDDEVLLESEENVFENIRKHAKKEYKKVFKEYFNSLENKEKDSDISEKISNFSKDLEDGTYKYALERIFYNTGMTEETVSYHELKTVYKQVYVKVVCNIKLNKNNSEILKKIIDKKINVNEIAKMHREVLFPNKWDTLYKNRTEELKKKKRKGAHRCPRCKSWYTDHVEFQAKSSDEPMNVRCTCEECGYTWKY